MPSLPMPFWKARVFGIDREIGSLEIGVLRLQSPDRLEGWPHGLGGDGRVPQSTSTTFVRPSALDCDLAVRLGPLQAADTAIGTTRNLTKADMLHNTALPEIHVNPQTLTMSSSTVSGRGAKTD